MTKLQRSREKVRILERMVEDFYKVGWMDVISFKAFTEGRERRVNSIEVEDILLNFLAKARRELRVEEKAILRVL